MKKIHTKKRVMKGMYIKKRNERNTHEKRAMKEIYTENTVINFCKKEIKK